MEKRYESDEGYEGAEGCYIRASFDHGVRFCLFAGKGCGLEKGLQKAKKGYKKLEKALFHFCLVL